MKPLLAFAFGCFVGSLVTFIFAARFSAVSASFLKDSSNDSPPCFIVYDRFTGASQIISAARQVDRLDEVRFSFHAIKDPAAVPALPVPTNTALEELEALIPKGHFGDLIPRTNTIAK